MGTGFQPIYALAASNSQSNYLCSQLDLLHGLVINGTGPGKYSTVDGASLWSRACSGSSNNGVVQSYSENRTILTQWSVRGQSFIEDSVQYSMALTNGQTSTGTMYEVLYIVHAARYNLTVMSMLLDGTVVSYANYVPSTGQNGAMIGDDIVTTTNSTLGQYYGLLAGGVQYLALGYLTSRNATLQTLGSRYLDIALDLHSLQHLVLQSPIATVRIQMSSTLVVDSSQSCFLCQLLVQSAEIAGCAAACFIFLPACFVCVPLVEQARELGSEAACGYFHFCP